MPPDFKDQKQFYCDQCPDVFLTKHSLHLHRIKWHPTGKDLYQVHIGNIETAMWVFICMSRLFGFTKNLNKSAKVKLEAVFLYFHA